MWLDLVVPDQLSITTERDQGVAVEVWSRATGAVGPAFDSGHRRWIPTTPKADTSLRVDRGREPESAAAIDIWVTPEALFHNLPEPFWFARFRIDEIHSSTCSTLI